MFINLSMLIEQFMIEQELKGNSPKTLKYYRRSLQYFIDYVGDKPILDITLLDLQQYALNIKNRPKYINHPFHPQGETPITTTSMQTYIRALRVFLSWLYNEEYISTEFNKKFRLPKATKKTVEVLTEKEIKTIFSSLNIRTVTGMRSACLCALMLDSGLRLGEAIGINIQDIDFSRGIIKVLGKGNKERIVPLGVQTRKHIIKYITKYRGMHDTDKLLMSIEGIPLSQNAVKQIFVRLREKTNIEKLHPHLLRHTFATNYLINGGDIFSLQQILGHTSLDMVKRYSHLSASFLMRQHKYNSPLDKLYSN
ncbi:MAG: hypothetical protein A2Y23_11845 [Clostridiales bacterium GWB2_37_7]|nr:MAG: hypothetical protein A2Y23_11845 [Clostridiales bacterium GWB2_37_7]